MIPMLADSFPVPCIVVLVIFVGLWVLGSVSSSSSSGSGGQATRPKQTEQGLSVSVQPDTVLAEDGESFEIMRVVVSGTITVPHDGYQSMWRIWLDDITEGSSSPQPVFCMIPDVADEDGCFAFEERLRVPHACSEIDGMEIGSVPGFALVCPRRGPRRLRVAVTVTAPTDPDRIWSAGYKTIEHHETKVGYLEYERHSREQDERVARLAVAVALADGRFDKAEARVIRRHFFQRYMGETDEAQRKQSISRVMKETLTRLNQGGGRVGKMIGRMAREMQSEDDLSDKRDAYELCVQIVGADGEVTDRELKSIGHIVDKLELPQAVVQEVHDRHLRVSMIREEAFDPLSMPTELSKAEKLKWLAEEYRRWHPRQNHKDREVRQEAENRIELIAKRRKKVRDGVG